MKSSVLVLNNQVEPHTAIITPYTALISALIIIGFLWFLFRKINNNRAHFISNIVPKLHEKIDFIYNGTYFEGQHLDFICIKDFCFTSLSELINFTECKLFVILKSNETGKYYIEEYYILYSFPFSKPNIEKIQKRILSVKEIKEFDVKLIASKKPKLYLKEFDKPPTA